jgi:hypothetical protein
MSPRRVVIPALAAVAAAAALAGCGTPAVVKAVQNPLPGLNKDIQAAKNVVTQSEQEAQNFGSTGVTAP